MSQQRRRRRGGNSCQNPSRLRRERVGSGFGGPPSRCAGQLRGCDQLQGGPARGRAAPGGCQGSAQFAALVARASILRPVAATLPEGVAEWGIHFRSGACGGDGGGGGGGGGGGSFNKSSPFTFYLSERASFPPHDFILVTVFFWILFELQRSVHYSKSWVWSLPHMLQT